MRSWLIPSSRQVATSSLVERLSIVQPFSSRHVAVAASRLFRPQSQGKRRTKAELIRRSTIRRAYAPVRRHSGTLAQANALTFVRDSGEA